MRRAAQAGSVTFDASGTFEDGATLSGTMTIDTTVGQVTAVNLVVSAPDSLDLTFVQYQSNTSYSGDYFIQTGPTATGLPNFLVVLPVTTLVGYSGGSIGSTTQPANSIESNVYPVTTLTVGSLSAVPEPSSLVLAGTAGLGLWTRRRRG